MIKDKLSVEKNIILKKGNIQFETPRLILKEISLEDSDNIVRWRNDDEIRYFLFDSTALTMEKHFKWFERYKEDKTRIDVIIIEKATKYPIGTAGLQKIDFQNKKCSISYMIGEKSAQGKGYGLEAIGAMCEFGFIEFGIRKIYAEIDKKNVKSILLILKAGFSYDEAKDYMINERNFRVYSKVLSKSNKIL